MSARKGESYRDTLAQGEREHFRHACLAGIDPKAQCTLCWKRRLTRELRSRWCADHQDFENAVLVIDCHTCQVRYRVHISNPDHKATA